MSKVDAKNIEINGLAFGVDAFRDRTLSHLNFRNCYFSATSLEVSKFSNCTFVDCKFGQLRLYTSTSFNQTAFVNCSFESLRLVERDLDLWDPNEIHRHLQNLGIRFGVEGGANNLSAPVTKEVDSELQDVEKLIRYFMRSTHISESVMLIRLGNRGQVFIDDSVPELLNYGVLVEIENLGGGTQRRFKLGMPLQRLNSAISTAEGSYRRFLELCTNIAA